MQCYFSVPFVIYIGKADHSISKFNFKKFHHSLLCLTQVKMRWSAQTKTKKMIREKNSCNSLKLDHCQRLVLQFFLSNFVGENHQKAEQNILFWK